MSVKKILAPNIAILLALSVFWFAGVEPVVKRGGEDQKNFKKYVQTQPRVIDNYVDPVNITNLYKHSIKGLGKYVPARTARLENTPADTTFDQPELNELGESITMFEKVYRYVDKTWPNEDMPQRTEDAIQAIFRSRDPDPVYIEPDKGNAMQD